MRLDHFRTCRATIQRPGLVTKGETRNDLGILNPGFANIIRTLLLIAMTENIYWALQKTLRSDYQGEGT